MKHDNAQTQQNVSPLVTWAAKIAIPITRAMPAYSPLQDKVISELDRRINWRGPRVIATSRDSNRFHCTLSDEIQRSIAYRGDWDPGVGQYIRRHLKAGDTFIDCGANIGYFSLLASRRVGPTGRVVAIEASPPIHEMLCANIRLNRIENVRTAQIAVAAEPGRLKLYAGNSENIGRTTTEEARGLPLLAEVEAASLFDIVTPDELRTARIIKIDIEGAELPVLRDMLKQSSRLPPQFEIIVELSPDSLIRMGSTPREVIADFAAVGYHAYAVKHDELKARRIRVLTETKGWFDVVFSKIDAEEL